MNKRKKKKKKRKKKKEREGPSNPSTWQRRQKKNRKKNPTNKRKTPDRWRPMACRRASVSLIDFFFIHRSIDWFIFVCFFLNRRRRRRELNVHRTNAISFVCEFFFRFYGSVVAIGWRRNQSRIWLAVAGWRCVPYGRRVPIWRITTLLFFLH